MKRPKGKGRSWERGQPGFDARVLGTSFNGRDPGHRPEILVEANDVSDVQRALAIARDRGLQVSICSGGHSWAQNHLRDGGVLLSMARINQIEIDAAAGLARVGPGCWSADLDRALRPHKLFFPVAHAADVAMGGFLLQGGFGWASRELGIATESVVGLDLVLADGTELHASATENAELFWAARGSGPGFFAVVVCYHLKLHPRFKFFGLVMQVFRRKHLEDVYRWAADVGPDVPRSIEFQMLLTRKATGIYKPGIEVIAPVLTDSRKQAREDLRFVTESPLRSKASFTTPLVPVNAGLLSRLASFTLFPPDVRWSADNMWTNASVDDLLPGIEHIADTMPPAPSHSLWMNWYPTKGRPDMAYSLEGNCYMAVYGEWKNPADDRRYENWAGDCMEKLSEHAIGMQLADENLGRRPARFMKDENLRRLDELREKYDGEQRFHSWMGRPFPAKPKHHMPDRPADA
ncbi:MAG: FAD-binding oxidoreductase [Pseudomonadota bacterium]